MGSIIFPGKQIGVVVYILVKPPGLNDMESIEDAFKTIEYLYKLSNESGISIVPKLEPAVISKGTMQEALFLNDKYFPLSYWSVIEIITKARLKVKDNLQIRIGGRHDMDEIVKVPALYEENGTLEPYDYIVYDAIQNFNQHQNLIKLFSSILEHIIDIDTEKVNVGKNFYEWKKNAEIKLTNIEEFIDKNKKEIINEFNKIKTSRDYILFHKDLSRVLIDIEETDKSQERANQLYKNNSKKCVANDVQLFVNSIFATNATFDGWRPKVVSYVFEMDKRKNLRINIDLVNLNDNQSRYDLWVLIPSQPENEKSYVRKFKTLCFVR